MIIKVNFVLTLTKKGKRSIPKEISERLHQLRETIKAYRTKQCFLDDAIYWIEDDNPAFIDIVQFVQQNLQYIDLIIFHYYVHFSEEEAKTAVAFIPQFYENCYTEYADLDDEYYKECPYCYSVLERTPENRYAQPQGYLKRHAQDAGVLIDETLEEAQLVMPVLYHALIENGIPSEYFRPVQTKRKKILAYELVTDHILEDKDFLDENYQLETDCSVCHTKNYIPSSQYHYCHKYISRQAAQHLKPVNCTRSNYERNRIYLVNREVYEIIHSHNEKACFFPVFCKE